MSKSVHLEEIPYCHDASALFERLRDMPGAAFLDSSYPHSRQGRFDVLTAEPLQGVLPEPPADLQADNAQRYFAELSAFHREHYGGIQPVTQDIPFCGGVLGYFGYELGNALHGLAPGNSAVPAIQLGAFEWCVVQDHLLRKSVLASLPGVDARRRGELLARLRKPAPGVQDDFELTGEFRANLNAEEYQAAFRQIEAYIQAGDCYQVNLSQRLAAPCRGDAWFAYRKLRAAAGAPFAAYLTLDHGGTLLCLSPERFLSLHGHRVETSPIKGTRPRYADLQADEMAARELLASDKDRAENLMIVDLLRNDLGRNCVPGSIHVDRLFEVQSFPTVHHLVSTISGELVVRRDAWDLLRDSFPGGSITGAPKRRAMQIIAELEPDSREAYCGSVFYVSADGRMDSNIAIRSMVCDGQQIRCWAGGGIVADSSWQLEYQESWDKVAKLLATLQ